MADYDLTFGMCRGLLRFHQGNYKNIEVKNEDNI
jgi:hypothetical protein